MLGCQSKRLVQSGRSCRNQWPADGGRACLCYDTMNAECVATCASDIYDYHISRSNGTGLVVASCPQGTSVLGCGSASPTNGQSRRRAAVVAMGTSCRCYDDREVTCYATCGLFMAESSYSETSRLIASKNSSAIAVGCNSQLKTIILFLLGLVVILSQHD